jgi:hypothetical protein
VCLIFFILQSPEAPVVLRVTPLQAMSIATTKKSGSCFSPALSPSTTAPTDYVRAGIPDAFCRLTMYDTTFKKIGQVSRTLTAHNGRSLEPQWQDQECCLYLHQACP